ncbi:HNH/endonuclease VII fold putative polymorphic toxin [Rahnella woolbedingensis]|uniref:HNH/endonuclease VII fold putative polymorphic toxin n=1 Tax=Rahnella woolbedingensis TaxID=1510574 RepID=UPI001ABFAF2A
MCARLKPRLTQPFTFYHVNSNDQIVHAEQKGARPLLELFEYDAALNIIGHQQRRGDDDVPPERINQTQQAGRVIRRGNGEYRYDSAGRLAEKRTEIPGYRPQVWRYRWDANSQMRGLVTPDGEQWHYRYDAFGRRISKRRQETTRSKLAGYDYLWSGDQLIEETPVYADSTPAYEESIHWLYEPGALTPAARREKGQLHYVVSDHMGTPRELLTEKGDVAWASRLSTWGDATRYRPAANDDKLSCNLRFAGQYADEESGLHYNRHRYYDSETGQYLSPDPIGLAGGINPYGYVHNPLSWVDPLGLACCPPKFSSRNEAFRAAKRDAGIPMGEQPVRIFNPKTGFEGDHRNIRMTDSNNNPIFDSNGNQIWTREYQYTKPDGSKIIIEDHSAGHSYPDGIGNQGAHVNVRPSDNTRSGSVPGTSGHYNF